MKNDQAVSPVIGVIAGNMEIGACTMPHIIGGETYGRDKSLVLNYWFASTVILAAVIAAFVFGMAGQITKTKVVAVTVQRPAVGVVSATYQGGQDASSFEGAVITATQTSSSATSEFELFKNVGSSNSSASANAVNSGTFTAGKIQVVGVGYFDDGTTQVLIDTFI